MGYYTHIWLLIESCPKCLRGLYAIRFVIAKGCDGAISDLTTLPAECHCRPLFARNEATFN
jgi:hypothetical protein